MHCKFCPFKGEKCNALQIFAAFKAETWAAKRQKTMSKGEGKVTESERMRSKLWIFRPLYFRKG